MSTLRLLARQMMESGIPERRAVVFCGIHRSTFRYTARAVAEKAGVRARVLELARKHRRFGTPRITALLRGQGLKIHHKCVERIWKEEKLALPRKRHRRKRGILMELPNMAAKPNHVWTYDFLFDRTARDEPLKILVVLDEWTREALAIRVARRMSSCEVRDMLEELFLERGAPEFIRSHNGPEFIADERAVWLARHGTGTVYIEPGHPWENGHAESFIGKFRDECLNEEIFLTMKEAQVVVELWRRYYNEERPHSSLGYKTPGEFARLSRSRAHDGSGKLER